MYENLSQPMPLQKEIKLYTGTGNPALAEKVADILHLELQGLKIEKFANGEIYARFDESVRGDDVFFIQSLSGANVNDLLMETLVVADAAKRASADHRAPGGQPPRGRWRGPGHHHRPAPGPDSGLL